MSKPPKKVTVGAVDLIHYEAGSYEHGHGCETFTGAIGEVVIDIDSNHSYTPNTWVVRVRGLFNSEPLELDEAFKMAEAWLKAHDHELLRLPLKHMMRARDFDKRFDASLSPDAMLVFRRKMRPE